MTRPAFVQVQKQQQAKFMCSACGADRGCNCNAPAVEKLAEKLEQDRQRARKARAKKTLEKSTSASRDDFKWNEPIEVEDEVEVIARARTASHRSANGAAPATPIRGRYVVSDPLVTITCRPFGPASVFCREDCPETCAT